MTDAAVRGIVAAAQLLDREQLAAVVADLLDLQAVQAARRATADQTVVIHQEGAAV